MFRYLTKGMLTAVLGAALAGPASAQYFPMFGGGFNPYMGSAFMGNAYMMGNPYMMGGSYARSFYNPFTGGNFNYLYSPYGGYNGYSFMNPYTGQQMTYIANVPYMMSYGGYGGGYAAPSYGGGSMMGGYGSYASSSNNRVTNEQLRLLRSSAYQSAYPGGSSYSEPRSVMSPRWTSSKTEKSTAKPEEANEALLRASEKDILSGTTLNALAAEILKLEGKGARAEAPLLPAEVLTKVALESTASDAKGKPPAIPKKWSEMGGTVSELVRFLDSNKLQFAPAPAGTGDVYTALHRGLSGYYVALTRAKK